MEQVLELFTGKSKFLLIAGAVLLLLEFLRPARRQRKWRRDSGLDLIYAFTVPLIVYPASVLFNTWLIEQFWPTLPNTGPRQQIVAQAPEHGQVIIELSGAVTYHPSSGFQGIDRYTITTEHNQNTIRQTFLVKVASPIPASNVSGQNASPAIYIAEANKEISGKVTEGISGFFFHLRQTIQEWNLGLQLLIATFLIDLTGYWRHRLMHTRFLWPFHAIHHSSKELDWLSNERFHPVNACITSLLGMAVLILFFKDPFVFALAIPLRAAYGMFIHSNVKISYGVFDTVFASPLFHQWHHAANEKSDKNYCTFFSFLDRMFGTYYLPKYKGSPASLGLAKDDLANHYLLQLAYPFIKLASQKPADPSRQLRIHRHHL